jgi:hypothetical protein
VLQQLWESLNRVAQDNPVPDASVLLLTMHPPFLSIAAVARFY